MSEKEIKLKVVEAFQDDVNKGIVRIDSGFMREIDVKPGDIVSIKGERETVGIVDRAYPGDIGLNIIKMDGLMRRNGRTGIGESVSVKKADIKEAKKITIAPLSGRIQAPPQLFKRGLLGRAVVRGDIVSIGGTQTRKNVLSHSPFDEIFKVLEGDLRMSFGIGGIKFMVADVTPKQAVIITNNTELTINSEPIKIEEETLPEIAYEDIGGLEDEIKKIREMVELPLKHPELFERLGIEAPKGVLIHGPPGTGKTLLAKAVANETNSHFILINGPEIMSKFYGQSEQNIRKKFEDAEKNAPSIIFIDEIDAIAPKREESKGEVERRVVAQLLTLMDGMKSRERVIVLAATNRPNDIDPALRRPGRFDREIIIGVPDKESRLEILKIHTRNMPLSKNINLEKFAEMTSGFSGADLELLAKEAAMIKIRKLIPTLKLKVEEKLPERKELTITKKEFEEAFKSVVPSAMREVLIETPTTEWESIGGLDKVKRELIEAVEWPLKQSEAFKRMGVKPPKGILLYGPPGTGKTLIVKAVANKSKSNFIYVNGQELQKQGIVGKETAKLREIFKKARHASPSIVFFDEIDSFTKKRGLSSGVFADSNQSLLNTLLMEMDGLEELKDVLVIAATNRPDIIDSALLRPGRFDRIILTPVPDKKAREAIFKIHTEGMPLKEVGLNTLAEKTEGYVGADIEAVCREAAIDALRKDIKSKNVTLTNFNNALKIVRASVAKDIEKKYEDIKEEFAAARAKEIKETPSYMG